MGIDHKGSQGQTQRAVVLQEEMSPSLDQKIVFYETGRFITCSQETGSGPHSEPVETRPHSNTLFLQDSL
jgi:hypothetical protein